MIAIQTTLLPTTSTASKFTPSKYQTAIYNWLENGSGSLLIDAVAGSGKTTTVVEMANRIVSGKALFLAFNKKIAEKLNTELPKHAAAKTIHSLGYSMICRAFGKCSVTPYKYSNRLEELNKVLSAKYYLPRKNFANFKMVLVEGFGKYRLTQMPIHDLVKHFNLELPQCAGFNEMVSEIGDAYDGLIEWGLTQKSVDFTDMVFFPHHLNLDSKKKYDYIFVDEAQDISQCHISIIKAHATESTRVIAAGDKNQAIYGFAGAGVGSIEKITKEFEMKRLPLSVCYRCPKSHIKLAKKSVEAIEPSDTAKEGVVNTHLGFNTVDVKDGDYIICRRTAPLIEACLDFISEGRKATVLGRGIGDGIKSHLYKILAGRRYMRLTFLSELVRCSEQLTKALDPERDFEKIQSLHDKSKCLKAIFSARVIESVSQFCEIIDSIFDLDNASITLSTIHRVKGLEADTIWILEYSKLRTRAETTSKDWVSIEEKNIHYVGVTRSRKVLNLVL